MIEAVETTVIAVPALVTAVAGFSKLLAVAPARQQGRCAEFLLRNGVLRLVQRNCEQAAVVGLDFLCSGLCSGARPHEYHGVLEFGFPGRSVLRELRALAPSRASPLGIDHVVVASCDGDASAALLRDQFGIRLALDRTVPEWGGRLLFFRPGGYTIEVIAGQRHSGPDRFWGLALACDDIELQYARLVSAGVGLSSIREGRKPGTRVATVRSATLGIPTLLLGPG
jgi:hypothetical protein